MKETQTLEEVAARIAKKAGAERSEVVAAYRAAAKGAAVNLSRLFLRKSKKIKNPLAVL